MTRVAVLLAVCLTAAVAPFTAEAHAGGAGCVTSPAKITETPKLSLPENAKLTSKSIAFEIDLGSDGRVRGVQMDQSSGDQGVDLGLKQALQTASYQPPQTGCVAYSGGLYLSYSLSSENAAPAAPAALTPTCTPYVAAFLTPNTRDRKRTGTAVVAVDLDASGTQTGAPALRKTTGSPALDAEALRIAQTGHYGFLRASSCTPQAFVYLLELTFQ